MLFLFFNRHYHIGTVSWRFQIYLSCIDGWLLRTSCSYWENSYRIILITLPYNHGGFVPVWAGGHGSKNTEWLKVLQCGGEEKCSGPHYARECPDKPDKDRSSGKNDHHNGYNNIKKTTHSERQSNNNDYRRNNNEATPKSTFNSMDASTGRVFQYTRLSFLDPNANPFLESSANNINGEACAINVTNDNACIGRVDARGRAIYKLGPAYLPFIIHNQTSSPYKYHNLGVILQNANNNYYWRRMLSKH